MTPGRIAASLFATLALASSAARASPGGSVYVTTLPAQADVWVDGTYVGRSPALVSGLPAGRHALTLSKQGWTVREVQVAVADGSIAMSSTALVAGPRVFTGGDDGVLVVRSVPAGAKIRLDGVALHVALGKGVPVAPGPHELTLDTGRDRTSTSVDVLADTTTTVVVQKPQTQPAHSGVVAPAEDYLPTDNFSVDGTKVSVRYAGHVVSGRLGDPTIRFDRGTVAYDSAPELIGGKLYLPLALLELLSGDTSK